LLDVRLDPSFESNHLIYLSYSEPDGRDAGTAVLRARLGPLGIDNLRVIFRQLPKVGGGLHFGSRLVFSQDGQYLFITMGERGRKDDAQDLSRLMGRVVRIRPDGSIPDDNPFVGRTNARPETWSYGHRNPQGAAIHPETGELWTVEHAAMGGDEVNTPKPGRNYGWPVITYGVNYDGQKIGEGTAKEGMEQPVHYWDPSIAPSGMTFYTGDRYPGWKGSLFVGSLKFGLLSRLTLEGNRVVSEERLLTDLGARVRDVRQGPDGYLYLLTDESNGRILRLEPN
jgi:glucose/arabinose dehydrogenase